MKYLKIISITILIVIIMIIQVNATTLTLPDLPGEYEDYIIFNGSSLYNESGDIYAITFNNLENMYVGTYEEYLYELNLDSIEEYENTYHTHDILYFKGNLLESNYFKLVGDEWDIRNSHSGLANYRFGFSGYNSIKSSDILYSSKNIIDLTDGSVFFSKGSWMKAGMVHQMLGIIPFLIGLLIISVGFSKGLQFLFKTLRKA